LSVSLIDMRAKLMMVAVMAAAGLVVPASTAYATTPQCTNGELVATYRAGDAGMSHRFGRIILTNVSDHTCKLGGYGGLSYVGGGDGTQIGAPADRVPGTVRAYVLTPGERVKSNLSETVASVYPRRKCRPTPVDGFRVYVPNETRAQFVRHRTIGCANPRIHLLSHQPYRKP
jgi:hypothetical protein